jgi:hypothetical protein
VVSEKTQIDRVAKEIFSSPIVTLCFAPLGSAENTNKGGGYETRRSRPQRGDLLVIERTDTEWPDDEVQTLAEGLRGAVCANDVSVFFVGPQQSVRRLPAEQARDLIDTYERRFGKKTIH